MVLIIIFGGCMSTFLSPTPSTMDDNFEGMAFQRAGTFREAREERLQVRGPLFHTRPEDAIWLHRMASFRTAEHLHSAPYLLAPAQSLREQSLQLDERSAHFLVTEGSRVVAAVRLTTPPFESESLAPAARSLCAQLSGYSELSRLVTSGSFCRRARSARLLLLKAGLWLFRETPARGFFGICRPSRETFFVRFGARVCATFPIAERAGDYRFIVGDREQVLRRIAWNE
jgi:hypothetical protein